MSSVSHELTLAGPTGAVFRVTDGASQCVATGMHRVTATLPQGLYTVTAELGPSVLSREVILDRPWHWDVPDEHQSFGGRAFGLGAQVLASLGDTWQFRKGGQFIALRGPWQPEAADGADGGDGAVTVDRDGMDFPSAAQGRLTDAQGGLWTWQLFNLRDGRSAPGAGVLSVTRVIEEAARGEADRETDPDDVDDVDEAGRPASRRVSHPIPEWKGRIVWAVYPAHASAAQPGTELPHPYYVRLRATRRGEAPDARTQGLSDQVFTALASRTGLPLSDEVVKLLLDADGDPLLAMAAAHLVSLRLGRRQPRHRLPHDGLNGADEALDASADGIDDAVLERAFQDWLRQTSSRDAPDDADLWALRVIFGLQSEADLPALHAPPLLLRSVDCLMGGPSDDGGSGRLAVDERLWAPWLQVSDAFAFVQWRRDLDFTLQLREHVDRAIRSTMSMQTSAHQIKKVWDDLHALPAEARRESAVDVVARFAAPFLTENTGEPARIADLKRRLGDLLGSMGNPEEVATLLRRNASQLRLTPDTTRRLHGLVEETLQRFEQSSEKLDAWVDRLGRRRDKPGP